MASSCTGFIPQTGRASVTADGTAMCDLPASLKLAPAWTRVENLARKMFLERNAPLIGPREDGPRSGRLTAVNTSSASTLLLHRDAAHGSARFFFDFGLAIGAPAPEGVRKTVLYGLLQVVVGFCVVRVALAESQSLVVKRLLDFRQQPLNGSGQAR